VRSPTSLPSLSHITTAPQALAQLAAVQSDLQAERMVGEQRGTKITQLSEQVTGLRETITALSKDTESLQVWRRAVGTARSPALSVSAGRQLARARASLWRVCVGVCVYMLIALRWRGCERLGRQGLLRRACNHQGVLDLMGEHQMHWRRHRPRTSTTCPLPFAPAHAAVLLRRQRALRCVCFIYA
jgi:hypothetical protein